MFAELRILALQNLEFNILADFKILADLKILAFQNLKFRIFFDFKILALQNP